MTATEWANLVYEALFHEGSPNTRAHVVKVVAPIIAQAQAERRQATGEARMTQPPRISQWNWWSDGFGWQPEDTVLIAMTLGLIALYSSLAICARIWWI